ncbi:MAG: proline-rich domain-containing protein [Candidatus Poseidoniales archaeon]
MNNSRKSIFLILLLSFSLIPLSVNADESGRYAYSVSASPYEVGTGGTVEIEAMVTGTQSADSEETTRYNIWAESNTEETYTIAQNKDAIDGMITYSWLVPESIPTGPYSICVEESDSGDMSQNSVMCDNINVIRYQIEVEVNNEIILPGETIRVWTTVSSPINGSPESPETAGWKMTYYTQDENSWDSDSQVKSGTLTPASSNEFAVLMPSNLLSYYGLTITFYANDSSGTQLSEVTKSVPVGILETTISQPSDGQTIPLHSDFVLQLNCKRITNQGEWMPEKGLGLTVKLEQGTIKTPVSISSTLLDQPSSIECDSDGIVSLLLVADNSVLEIGSAELVVYWTDPSSSEEVNRSIMIYLSAGDSESLVGVGIQVFIDGPLSSSEPGEEITLIVNTLDMAGNPLAGIWVHHLTSRSTTNSGSWYSSEADRSKWSIQQSDSQGKLTVLITIPSDLNPGLGSISLYATAKNDTGVLDQEVHQIRLIETKVTLTPITMEWLPGDEVEMRINVDGMTRQVAAFWSIEELDLEGQLTFAADSHGSFSFLVPDRVPFSSITVNVVAIDSSGKTESDSNYVPRLDGFSVMISPPNEVVTAGESITLPYVITTMDPTEPVEYPLKWVAMAVGVADSSMTGFVNGDSGSIEYTLPSNLESGSYVFVFNFETSQSNPLVLDVRSNDDASGVGGAFSAVGDSLDSASGWVSTSALILAFACLGLLLKGGGKKEEEWSGFDEPPLFSAPPQPVAATMHQPPAPMHQPPAAMHQPPAAMHQPPAAIPEYDPTSPTGYAQPPPQQR